MQAIIGWLVGKLFGSSPAAAVSNGVVNITAMLAGLAPVAIWLMKYDDTAAVIFKLPPWFEVQFTWGQFAFVFVLILAVLKIAHWADSPVQKA